MKKIIIAIIAIATFQSCKKEEEKSCWRCYIESYSANYGYHKTTPEIVCDMTWDERMEYQRLNTKEGESIARGKYREKMTCIK